MSSPTKNLPQGRENLPWRRECETLDIGPFALNFGFWPNSNDVMEVFVINRGKPGHDMDGILYMMGIAISKAIQGESLDDIVRAIGENQAGS